MTVLTDALDHPDITRNFLATVTAGYAPLVWTLDTGTTYYAAITRPVVDFKEDGSSLTEQSDLATTRSTTGSWFYDATNSRVYVNPTAGADPYTKTLQAFYVFYYSFHPKVFTISGDDVYFEPRLKSLPNLSLRVEAKFSGVSQIGGGSLTFNNEDGEFDSLIDLQWDAGSVVLRLGVDRITDMAYADYQVIGTWNVSNYRIDDKQFTLTLVESKINIKKKIPSTTYDRDTYANILEDDIGRAVQVAYGKIKDAKPVLIDTSLLKFKVAGHAVISFDGLRVKNETTGVWESKSFASTDKTNGEFTVSSADFTVDQEIVVDFTGRVKSGTQPMDNPSDVVKDLITNYVGDSNIDATSFSDSYNALLRGTKNDVTISAFALAIYLDEPISAQEVISKINRPVGAYLFADSSGQYFYRVFRPKVSEGLTEFDDTQINDFKVSVSTDILTKLTAEYDRRNEADWAEVYTFEDASRQYLHGDESESFEKDETVLSEVEDATLYAQRRVFYEGRPLRMYSFTVPSRIAITLMPSDFVRINYSRHGIDGVYEILSISHNLEGDKTSLVCGDMHGLGERPGWWVSSPSFPSRLGGASITGWDKTWTDEQKTWAKQNMGFWTDDNGFADPTDPDSRMISTWI